MNIENAVPEFTDDAGVDLFHVPGESDKVDIVRSKGGEEECRKFIIGSELLSAAVQGGEIVLPCDFECPGIGVVADDHCDTGIRNFSRIDCLEDCVEI